MKNYTIKPLRWMASSQAFGEGTVEAMPLAEYRYAVWGEEDAWYFAMNGQDGDKRYRSKESAKEAARKHWEKVLSRTLHLTKESP